jgi:hypothetical protein
MVRIGITYNPNTPLFYSGANQTALLFAELFSQHTVILVDYTDGDKTWWDDFPNDYPYDSTMITLSKLHQTRDLDFLLDIDGCVPEASRQRSSKKTIVFLRTFLQFTEMDSQLYIESPYVQRSMGGVDEIWCWDILNPPETIPSIQTMFPCPIYRVPFTWSPTVVSHYAKAYSWNPLEPLTDHPLTVHVAEKNTNNTSSSVLPLVAIRELHSVIAATYSIHNMDHIKENKFLKENVLTNIEFDKLPIQFVEKEPFYQWTSNDILLSHSRFIPLRLGLLNALWLGIPLIHNSPFLRDFHPVLKDMYYEGNSITEMIEVFQRFLKNPIRTDFREALSVFSVSARQTEWAQICNMFNETIEIKQTQLETEHVHNLTNLLIAFDDMWPGFNYNNNFIMDALRHEYPHTQLTGQKYDGTPHHLLIFGPYSEGWKKIPKNTIKNIPKVYFSGENWPHPTDPSISLYLSSQQQEDVTHMRIPTWMHFIDWFSNEKTLPTNQEDNPIRLPLHYATQTHPISFQDRQKFCAFVVSNPICQIRNDAFQLLHSYKPVSSGGAYQNNIGGQLHLKYPGGGCGDISKHHFFAEHQFTLSFENSQSPGYVTEKLLHAKMAGCLPLYWGSHETDFDPHSFINLSHMGAPSRIIEIVKHLETNPKMCAKIAATPLLDEQRKQTSLAMISVMAQRLMQLIQLQFVQPERTQTELTQPHLKENQIIDKVYLINLDSRPDRLQTFIEHSSIPFTRISAIDGKTLKMSEPLYHLCKKNLFQWKKSVIACALSHMSVWNKIVKDNATYTLILEDDMRFKPDWQIKNIPEDADLLYLGGVLPTNRIVYSDILEKVNDCWSKIKPNTYFTKEPTTQFHFCAYSYILTKRGAQKLLDYLQHSEDKLCLPCDHLISHPAIGLTKYVTTELQTFCFQEEDSTYNYSEFNDLHTEKKFDSDIYNNTECFSEADLSVYQVKDSKDSKESKSITLFYKGEKPDLYEMTWLQDMFQKTIELVPESDSLTMLNQWFLVQRPYCEQWNMTFSRYQKEGIPFNVLHLSDEFGTDNTYFYSFSSCKKVIRNYLRTDTSQLEKVITIPLGYHHKSTTIQPIQDRTLVWSFHGTDWFNRGEQLKQFMSYTPYHCHLQPQWNDPSKTKKQDYLAHLGNSKFCPILKGNNMETFRLYEALEAGTLPISVEKNAYTDWIDKHMNLSELYNWTNPNMERLITEPIQKEVMKRWAQWKKELQQICKVI